MKFRVFLAADHRGVGLKNEIALWLARQGHDPVDLGSHDEQLACDYPGYSLLLGEQVAATPDSRGILICMTGIGHSIAANKVPGVYAALCYNKEAAVLSRQHNNANVLVLGSKFVGSDELLGIIEAWLQTDFEGGRHLRRFEQIREIEKKFMKES